MDSRARQQALRMLSNGMYVMTSGNGEQSCAATVTWVSQASFQPPLLMAAVRKGSNVLNCLAFSQVAVLNILAQQQHDIARRFIARTSARSAGVNGEPFTTGITSAPILECVPAYVECRVCDIVDGPGDHAIVILEVIAAECRRNEMPLIVADTPWTYGG